MWLPFSVTVTFIYTRGVCTHHLVYRIQTPKSLSLCCFLGPLKKQRRRWRLIFLPSWRRKFMEAMVGPTTPGPPLSFPCFAKVTLPPPNSLCTKTVSPFLDILTLPKSLMFFKVSSLLLCSFYRNHFSGGYRFQYFSSEFFRIILSRCIHL